MTTAMTVSHAVSHGRTRGCVTRGATLEAPAAAGAAGVDSSASLLPAEPWHAGNGIFFLRERCHHLKIFKNIKA